jgi:ABC-type transport system substrate-binding protein
MGAAGRRPARAPLCLALLLLTAACTTGGPPQLVTSEIAQTSATTQSMNELTVGVDDLGGGFNPHTLADVGPLSLGIAGLVLPSAFRGDAEGAMRMDATLVESATVTAQQPFTVSYQLRREASWSDGAPIAAEDFAYLAERMRVEPGVVSPAGYRLIRQVNSRSGGKQVDVIFNRPYPGWRTLFANLLPAHLLKDAPGGWAQALETGIPVSGGPFAMRSVDPRRGVIVLERNDRYWGVPAVLDRLVLHQADQAGIVSALATGGDQLAVMRADSIGMALLRERAAHLAVRSLPEPVAAELLLRPASPVLSDPRLRAAVAAALDVTDLVKLGSGSGPGAALPAKARTLLPSESGYVPTITDGLPAMRANQDEVAALLAVADYEKIGTQWLRAGRPLRLVVAAPAERAAYRTMADRIVQQLVAAGIDAELVTPSGDELFATMAAAAPVAGGPTPTATSPAPSMPAVTPPPTPTPPAFPHSVPAGQDIDIAVVPRPVSGDPAADLMSWYGCPEVDNAGAGTDAAPVDIGAPPNPAGYCNPSLQAGMDDLLTGVSTLGETLAATETALWRDLPSIPLFQHAVVLVSSPDVDNVEPGTLLTGPFANAPRWRHPPR